MNATSGASAARQPTLRLAAAPESGAAEMNRTGRPSGALAFGPGLLGAHDDDLEPLARQRLARQRLEREGEASLSACGRDDHGDVRSGPRSQGRPHYARGLCGS